MPVEGQVPQNWWSQVARARPDALACSRVASSHCAQALPSLRLLISSVLVEPESVRDRQEYERGVVAAVPGEKGGEVVSRLSPM